MSHESIVPKLPIRASLVFLTVAVAVPWLGRDLLPMDTWLRFLLAILWVSAFVLAAFGAGHRLLGALAGPNSRYSGLLVILTGTAVLSWIGCIAGLIGVLKPWFLDGVFLLAMVAGIVGIAKDFQKTVFLPEGLSGFPGAILLLPTFLTLAVVTTPPVMYDVLHYHLAFPEQWLLYGRFHEFPAEPFSYLPSAHGMLFSYALSLSGAWGANAINWVMFVLASLTAGELARRIAGTRATVWAIACFALTPAFLETSAYASADLTEAAWAGAVLLLLLNDERLDLKKLFLAGFFAGSAAAAKYLAIAIVLIPLAFLLLYLLRHLPRRKLFLSIGTFGLGVCLSFGPWAARNLAWTHNPVYPYFQSVFGGPSCALDLKMDLARNLEHEAPASIRLARRVGAFIRRSFHPRVEGGLPGIHWLVLLAVAGCLRFRTTSGTSLWIYTLSGLIMWGFFVQYFRFLSPVLVAAAALAGAAATSLRINLGKTASMTVVFFLVFILGWNTTVLTGPLFADRLLVLAGRMTDQAFRQAWDSRSRSVDFVKKNLPKNAHILLVGECRAFGFDRKIFVDGPYRPSRLVPLAEKARSAEEITAFLKARGVTHLVINRGDMRRLAGVRQVEDYWFPASPRARDLLSTFFRDNLDILFDEDGVQVASLRSR